jgi:hypothetical protein
VLMIWSAAGWHGIMILRGPIQQSSGVYFSSKGIASVEADSEQINDVIWEKKKGNKRCHRTLPTLFLTSASALVISWYLRGGYRTHMYMYMYMYGHMVYGTSLVIFLFFPFSFCYESYIVEIK